MQSVFENGGMIGTTLDFGDTDKYLLGTEQVIPRPVFVGSQVYSRVGTTSSINVAWNLTGGIAAVPSGGDLIILAIAIGAGSTTLMSSPSASYTQLASFAAADTNNSVIWVGYRIASPADFNNFPIPSSLNTANAQVAVVFVWRSVDQTTPIDVTTTTATGNNGRAADPPAITPITSNTIIMAIGAAAYAGTLVNFTNTELSGFKSTSSNDTYDASIGAGYYEWTSGSFDPAAFSITGSTTADSWTAVTLAIRPATVEVPIYGNQKNSGLWTLPPVYDYEKTLQQPDSYFNYVSLLLNGDGINNTQNNTFLDSSSNNFSITRNGNVSQGSFSPYGNEWSVYFNQPGDTTVTSTKLEFADNAAFTIGSNNFTIEAYIYLTANTTTLIRLAEHVAGWQFRFNAGTTLSFVCSSNGSSYSNTVTSPTAIPINQWVHIALTRSETTFSLWVNGTLSSSATLSISIFNAASPLTIGNTSSLADRGFPGYISNFRFVNGTALYTNSFIPPTSPLSAVTNTVLLTCQSNGFKDNSSNNFSPIITGSLVSISNFSPFKPAAAYATGINGGSAYFDGAGDFLSLASNAAFALPGAFTWEAWFYPLRQMSTTDETMLTIVTASGGGGGGLQISHMATASGWGIAEQPGVWRLTTTTLPTVNAWNHLVIVRSGTGTNQTSIFLNGTRVANGTVATSFVEGQLTVGANSVAGEPVLGYLSDVRLVKDTAVYDPTLTTLTIPTESLNAVTNTQMLLNYTNAGIADLTRKTVLETVGSAQVSTTQKKFGTGALYFDGSGDYLRSIGNQSATFYTGDFTVEAWLYFTSTDSTQYIVVLDSTGGFTFNFDGGNFSIGRRGVAADLSYAYTITAGSWNHFAASRQGTTARLFINGSVVASGSNTQNYSVSGPLAIGGIPSLGGYEFFGYIDDLRITKGVARYTANFTPAIKALPLL